MKSSYKTSPTQYEKEEKNTFQMQTIKQTMNHTRELEMRQHNNETSINLQKETIHKINSHHQSEMELMREVKSDISANTNVLNAIEHSVQQTCDSIVQQLERSVVASRQDAQLQKQIQALMELQSRIEHHWKEKDQYMNEESSKLNHLEVRLM